MRLEVKLFMAGGLIGIACLLALLSLLSQPAWGGMMQHGSMGNMQQHMQNMMQNRFPLPVDPAALPARQSPGAQAFLFYCSQCHGVPAPGLHTQQEWPAVVARMNMRMRMMGRHGMSGSMTLPIEAPSPPELHALLDYLELYAQQPLRPDLIGALDTNDGHAFAITCSRCHALPDPRQHARAQWPGIVARMRANMTAMHLPPPDADTNQRVIDFLQQHTK